MALEVIKRDGSREPFDAEKIRNSIRAAAVDIDLPEEKISEITEKITQAVLQEADKVDEIATVDIREKILAELERENPEIAEAWRRYDREVKGIA
jgi:transcriptional repressor NrdR